MAYCSQQMRNERIRDIVSLEKEGAHTEVERSV
jgi:hypothetical protein